MAYNILFNRNIGLLTLKQQDKLKDSSVTVFGVGGLGGVIAEILTRSGIGKMKIVDRDKFELSNTNRQIYAFTDTYGRFKVDVTEEFLHKINPGVEIEKYYEITAKNVGQILHGTDLALLALDDVLPILFISRYARNNNIPLIEGWAIPYGNVRVFTSETKSLEEVYDLDIPDIDPDTVSAETRQKLNLEMLFELKKIKGIEDYYSPLAMERINSGQIPSFAPMVWLSAVLMSIEAVKIILDFGTLALSPDFALYDPFSLTIPKKG